MEGYTKIDNCRLCSSSKLVPIFDIGETTLANTLLELEDVQDFQFNKKEEFKAPLKIVLCKGCNCFQLEGNVHEDLLFKTYRYSTGQSGDLAKHFEKLADEVTTELAVPKDSAIIEIGSNDSSTMNSFLKLGYKRVVGIEPATNLASEAKSKGFDVHNEYFNSNYAERLNKRYKDVKLLLATNMFAHIDSPPDLVKGFKILMENNEGSVLVIENAYWLDTVQNKELASQAYHEHKLYYSIKPLKAMFERMGFEIFKVTRNSIQCGSFRLYVQLKGNKFKSDGSAEKLIKLEEEAGLYKIQTYKKIEKELGELKKQLHDYLAPLYERDYKGAFAGISAKCCTIASYFDLSKFVVAGIDDSPLKQMRYTSGSHLIILPSSELIDSFFDFAIIMSPNFKDLIIQRNRAWLKSGGRFIIPFPKMEVVDEDSLKEAGK